MGWASENKDPTRLPFPKENLLGRHFDRDFGRDFHFQICSRFIVSYITTFLLHIVTVQLVYAVLSFL